MHELLHILGDPAHWFAEVVMDGTITLAVLYPARLWLKRHDRRKHNV
jgi:hypothetical protein